jgi:hypothetical protein
MKTKVSQATEEEKTLLMNFVTRQIADDTAKLNEIFVIPMEISDDEDIDTFLKLKEQWVSVNKIEIENGDVKHTIFNVLSIRNEDIETLNGKAESMGISSEISFYNLTFELVGDKFEDISLNDIL